MGPHTTWSQAAREATAAVVPPRRKRKRWRRRPCPRVRSLRMTATVMRSPARRAAAAERQAMAKLDLQLVNERFDSVAGCPRSCQIGCTLDWKFPSASIRIQTLVIKLQSARVDAAADVLESSSVLQT